MADETTQEAAGVGLYRLREPIHLQAIQRTGDNDEAVRRFGDDIDPGSVPLDCFLVRGVTGFLFTVGPDRFAGLYEAVPAVPGAADGRKVQGCCPFGCGETLMLASGGYVTCMSLRCPRPDGVTDILADRESGHLVELGAATFTVRHPLRERLDDALLECSLHEHISQLDGPPCTPGWYRVTGEIGALSWEAIDRQEAGRG